MLTHIAIENLALVESAHLSFDAHLNVLTGESGAGKSILLDALSLVAGVTRPRSTVRAGAKEGRVEAQFHLSDQEKKALNARLADLSVDIEEELVLARVLDESGKSRCYVQGRLVPRTVLSELSSELMEFTDQGESHALRHPAAQLALLDTSAKLSEKSQQLRERYLRLSHLEQEVEQLTRNQEESERRRDFVDYQLRELEQLALDEYESALARLEEAKGARKFSELSGSFLQEIAGGENSLTRRLQFLARRAELGLLGDAGELTSPLSDALEALGRAESVLERWESRVELSPTEVARLEEFVVQVQDLARKHRVTPDALGERLLALRREQETLLTSEEQRDLLGAEAEKLRGELAILATQLHTARKAAAVDLERRITKELAALGLGKARLSFHLEEAELGPSGITHLTLGFSANPGSAPRPLGRVASGGELGRVLLAIRLATKERTPLLVLDEIDAGAGGQAAHEIGVSLRRASELGQILAVTHWPQVACQASQHFLVQKSTNGASTQSTVRELSESSRVDELCRMLGGDTATARPHANALLANTGTAAGKKRLRAVPTAA